MSCLMESVCCFSFVMVDDGRFSFGQCGGWVHGVVGFENLKENVLRKRGRCRIWISNLIETAMNLTKQNFGE